MSEATPPTAKRTPWLLLALLSIALNIGLVGYLVGKHSMAGHSPGPRMAPPTAGMGRFLHELEPTRRDELRPLIRAHGKSLRSGSRALRQAHRQLVAAIKAENFDPAATTAALEQIATVSGQRNPESTASFVALVRELSTAERQLLAASLSRRGHGKRGRFGSQNPPNEQSLPSTK